MKHLELTHLNIKHLILLFCSFLIISCSTTKELKIEPEKISHVENSSETDNIKNVITQNKNLDDIKDNTSIPIVEDVNLKTSETVESIPNENSTTKEVNSETIIKSEEASYSYIEEVNNIETTPIVDDSDYVIPEVSFAVSESIPNESDNTMESTSLATTPTTNTGENTAKTNTQASLTADGILTTTYQTSASAIEPPSNLNNYKVILSVDSVMYLNQAGLMQVWIGNDNVDVPISKSMRKDEKKMSNVSPTVQYARVTPIAPDFDVESVTSTICYKIDPGGTEILYSMKPKDEGNYRVSASIELFEREDCTGISIPKTALPLSVFVGVDMKKELSKKMHILEEDAWEKFHIFWIALMALIFSALIFVIRRFIKKKTGFEENA